MIEVYEITEVSSDQYFPETDMALILMGCIFNHISANVLYEYGMYFCCRKAWQSSVQACLLPFSRQTKLRTKNLFLKSYFPI